MLGVLRILGGKLSGWKTKKSEEPQVERRRKSRSKKAQPEPGTEIVYRHLKMRVTASNGSQLWKWLADHGWGVADFPNDRRQYVLLPADTYARLDLAASSEWPMMIRTLMRRHPKKA